MWILVVAALVAAGLCARSTLKSANAVAAWSRRRGGATELAAAPGEDLVAVQMRPITEQLHEQGRR